MDALTAPSVTNNAENVTPAENQHPLSNSKSLNSKNSSENRPKKHPRRLFGHRASDGQPPRQRSWFGGLSHSKSAKKTTTSKRPPSRRMSAPHLFGKKKKDTNKTMRARARTESTASGRSFPTPDHDPKAELDALLAADNDTLKNWSPSELIAAAAVDGTAHSETPVIPKTEPSSAVRSHLMHSFIYRCYVMCVSMTYIHTYICTLHDTSVFTRTLPAPSQYTNAMRW